MFSELTVGSGPYGTKVSKLAEQRGLIPEEHGPLTLSTNTTTQALYREISSVYKTAGAREVIPNFAVRAALLNGDEQAFYDLMLARVRTVTNFIETGRVAIASLGPSNAKNCYEPSEMGDKELFELHEHQIETLQQCLRESGVSGIPAFETFTNIPEALAAVRVLVKYKTRGIISFYVEDEKGSLPGGETLADAIKIVKREAGDLEILVGVNCFKLQFLEGIFAELQRKQVSLDALYPNAFDGILSIHELEGEPGALRTHEASRFAELVVPKALENGIEYVAGCCGTDEREIIELERTISLLIPRS